MSSTTTATRTTAPPMRERLLVSSQRCRRDQPLRRLRRHLPINGEDNLRRLRRHLPINGEDNLRRLRRHLPINGEDSLRMNGEDSPDLDGCCGCRRPRLCELAVVEPVVETLALQQLRVAALLDDLAPVH